MKSIDRAVEVSAQTTRNVFKRNLTRFAAVLLAALAIFVVVPNATPADAPQHHDQVPGFYRLKVGDLEVTALLDGPAVLDLHWLTGEKATLDGVVKALHEDPHMLDAADTGFLVNTGKQLILVDAGSGTWFGGGAYGHLVGNLRSAGYTPEEVDLVLVTHLHSDHIGGLTTQDGNRVFPNAVIYVAKAESDLWLSPEIAAKAPKDAQPFFHSAQAIAAPYIKAGKWHTFSGSEPIVDGMQLVPLHGHTPGHTAYEFSSQGKKNPVLGRHHPRTARPVAASRGHGGLRYRPDCGCSDTAAIAVKARSRGCRDRGAAYVVSQPGSPAQGGEWLAGRQWHLPTNGSRNSNAAGAGR
jgi:glyoxylase-like metal-dependent hydrolase (beta-lactamase superfamily II)